MSGTGPRNGNRLTRLLTDRRVNTKILIVLATLASVSIGLLLVASKGMAAIDGNAQEIYAQNLQAVNALGEVRALTMTVRLDVTNLAISHDTATRDKYQAAITQDDQSLETAVAAYRKLSPEEQANTDAYWAAFSALSLIHI